MENEYVSISHGGEQRDEETKGNGVSDWTTVRYLENALLCEDQTESRIRLKIVQIRRQNRCVIESRLELLQVKSPMI